MPEVVSSNVIVCQNKVYAICYSDFKDIHVTLRHRTDGYGIHLSGGLPPISVTYVQPGTVIVVVINQSDIELPGSEAESARIMMGDIVTEVNGQDCRKGVEISQIMELKTLIQQTSVKQEEPNIDVSGHCLS